MAKNAQAVAAEHIAAASAERHPERTQEGNVAEAATQEVPQENVPQAPAAAPQHTTIKVGDLEVRLNSRFAAGMTLDATDATILFEAYARQFRNNQEANATNRAKRLAAATTDADRDSNKPLTAEEIAALFLTYRPTIGGRVSDGPALSELEAVTLAVATKYWNDLGTRHNAALASGDGSSPLKGTTPARLYLGAPRKDKHTTQEAHNVVVESYNTAMAKTVAAMQAHSVHGPAIKALVEAELLARKAERDAKLALKAQAKAALPAVDISAEDMLG